MDGGFYGEDGRDDSNPPYNITAILDSPVNKALMRGLTEMQISEIRNKLDLGNCRQSFRKYDPCRYNDFCLFDLIKDPCETTSVADEFPLIVKKLKRKLMKYWRTIHPQKQVFIDPKANPIYYNNTWHTWLDVSNRRA